MIYFSVYAPVLVVNSSQLVPLSTRSYTTHSDGFARWKSNRTTCKVLLDQCYTKEGYFSYDLVIMLDCWWQKETHVPSWQQQECSSWKMLWKVIFPCFRPQQWHSWLKGWSSQLKTMETREWHSSKTPSNCSTLTKAFNSTQSHREEKILQWFGLVIVCTRGFSSTRHD